MLGPPWCRVLGGSAACRGNKLLLSLCSGDLSSAPGEAGSPPPLSLSSAANDSSAKLHNHKEGPF